MLGGIPIKRAISACLAAGAISTCHAIEIVFDYSRDLSGFFTTNPEAKVALEAAADVFEEMIHDDLLRIDQSEFPGASWGGVFVDPATGGNFTASNLIVPEDTLIIFAGGRAIAGAGSGGPGGYSIPQNTTGWVERVVSRGQAGAFGSGSTDFAPWGGSVTFSTIANWNFSLTETGSSGQFDFLPVALHEIGHVFGIGTATSWISKISGNQFIGPNTLASYSQRPQVTGDRFHWIENPTNPSLSTVSSSYGSFNNEHGTAQTALMVPTLYFTGDDFLVLTDLDLAALQDIGWEVRPPGKQADLGLSLTTSSLGTVEWNTVTGLNYQLLVSNDLQNYSVLSNNIAGDGTRQLASVSVANPFRSFMIKSSRDPFPPVGSALRPAAESSNSALKSESSASPSEPVETLSIPPVQVHCGDCDHDH